MIALADLQAIVEPAGVLLGAASGFYGGWLDLAGMRVSEVFQVIPTFILAAFIIALSGPGLSRVVMVIALLSWPQVARLMRGEVLRDSQACWLVSYDNNLFLLDQALFSADWFRREFVLVDRTVVSPVRSLQVFRRRAGVVSERR